MDITLNNITYRCINENEVSFLFWCYANNKLEEVENWKHR